jgi:hypothetical protein
MDIKIKIIIVIFIIIAILYLIHFIMSNMQKIKQKESFIEMQIEDFTDQEETKKPKAYDVRLAILDSIEKFVDNKEERINVMNQMFKNIDSYKSMDKNSISKAVESFVNNSRSQDVAADAAPVNPPATVVAPPVAPPAPPAAAPATSSTDASKINQLSNDIDSLYTQLSSIKSNANNLAKNNKLAAEPPVVVKSPVIETFVDGFEPYSRSFATYNNI